MSASGPSSSPNSGDTLRTSRELSNVIREGDGLLSRMNTTIRHGRDQVETLETLRRRLEQEDGLTLNHDFSITMRAQDLQRLHDLMNRIADFAKEHGKGIDRSNVGASVGKTPHAKTISLLGAGVGKVFEIVAELKGLLAEAAESGAPQIALNHEILENLRACETQLRDAQERLSTADSVLSASQQATATAIQERDLARKLISEITGRETTALETIARLRTELTQVSAASTTANKSLATVRADNERLNREKLKLEKDAETKLPGADLLMRLLDQSPTHLLAIRDRLSIAARCELAEKMTSEEDKLKALFNNTDTQATVELWKNFWHGIAGNTSQYFSKHNLEKLGATHTLFNTALDESNLAAQQYNAFFCYLGYGSRKTSTFD